MQVQEEMEDRGWRSLKKCRFMRNVRQRLAVPEEVQVHEEMEDKGWRSLKKYRFMKKCKTNCWRSLKKCMFMKKWKTKVGGP